MVCSVFIFQSGRLLNSHLTDNFLVVLYVDALPGLVLTKFFLMKKIESSFGNLPGPRRTETDCATVGFSSAYVKL